MLMMIKLDNYIFFKKIFTRLLCIIPIIFLFLYEKNAFSQNYNLQKESSSNIVGSNIKVSELSKPSLGSLGVNTKANKLLGLNIWQNMNAEEIIEHLNYIPDTLASKHLQNFLNDLYLSTSVPPIGKSDEILKFLETRLFKIKNSGQSKNLYQLVTQLPNGERWKIWRKWQIEYELITRQDKKACQFINNESKINI